MKLGAAGIVENAINVMNPGTVFSIYDFIGYGSYDDIKKIIYKSISNKNVDRIIDGLFYKMSYDSCHPSLDDVAKGIARRCGWTISPARDVCCNMLGLNGIMPNNYEYYSTGQSCSYKIYGETLRFISVPEEDLFDLSPVSVVVIAAIRIIGYRAINEGHIEKIRKKLSTNDLKRLVIECENCTPWIYRQIKRLCSG